MHNETRGAPIEAVAVAKPWVAAQNLERDRIFVDLIN